MRFSRLYLWGTEPLAVDKVYLPSTLLYHKILGQAYKILQKKKTKPIYRLVKLMCQFLMLRLPINEQSHFFLVETFFLVIVVFRFPIPGSFFTGKFHFV
jgi:hypothetical protein